MRVLNHKTNLSLILFLVVSSLGTFFPVSFLSAAPRVVPFTSQAPFGDWRQPYQDFCEEASIVMTAHFIWGLPLSAKTADMEMQIIKTFEDATLGYSKDTSAQEVATVLKTLYGFKNVSTKEIDSSEDIIKELRQGKIIITPVAGRMLKNPYFVPPGPVYHMLVIKGFDEKRKTFITNDPGTRRGENFSYGQRLLFAAIHDWNNGDVMNGKKMAVLVGK